MRMTSRTKNVYRITYLLMLSHLATTVSHWLDINAVYSGSELTLVGRIIAQLPTLLAFLLFIGSGTGVRTWFSKLQRGVSFSFFMTLLVGMVFLTVGESSLRYIAGDAFRFLMPWLNIFLIVGVYTKFSRFATAREIDIYIERFVLILFVIMVLDGVATVILYTKFPYGRISTFTYLPLVFLGIYLFKTRGFLATVALLVGLAALLIGGKRGNITGVIVVLSAMLFISAVIQSQSKREGIRTTYIIKMCVASIAVMAVGLILFSSQEYSHFVNRIVVTIGNLEQTYTAAFLSATVDQSVQGRFSEVGNVMSYFNERKFLVFTGAGFGAEVPMIEYTGQYTDKGNMHHVHIVWVAYLLRNGVFGVMLLAAYFWTAILTCLKALKFGNRPYASISLALLLLDLVLSTKANVMLEHSPFAAIMFLCFAMNPKDLASVGKEQINGR